MLFSRLVAIIWVLGIVSGQPTLPVDEVESLRVIARTLGKSNWDFSVDPCSESSGRVLAQNSVEMNDENARTCHCTFQNNTCQAFSIRSSGWAATQDPVNGYENALTCDCTFFNNTICHVVSIILKAQNLSGSIPRELIGLPFLREIDLTRNYLNGTIPPEWGSMNLVNISLRGNRVSGSIPTQLANISSLTILNLDYNQLSGTIPPEFGNLPRIERLTLNSNNLTGELPATLANLSTLIDFRISDNNFQGSIPSFIQSWTNIKRLEIQGSGLSGPIPSHIAFGPNLTDLRISDLSGNNSNFPNLRNIRGLMMTLILRSCNIVGELPIYIGQMSRLKVLDLSFNKLSGPIPASITGLQDTDYIYLTGNSLSGPVPDWILNYTENVDLSSNNFTPQNSEVCQPRNINLFASSKGNTSGIVSCLQTTSCDKEHYSLHINCGGRKVVDSKGTIYEVDTEAGGASNYVPSWPNWGFSSTGHFLNNNNPRPSFIWQNSSVIISGDNPQLYTDARLSPLSLSYYGFCLRNGSYTVNLYFAEIILRNDTTFYSVGRRLFDVYIQGQRVLKDFNIESEAGGVNRGIRRSFTAVVTDTTLDIRFYWAGKGTNGIPFSGVYGPLISAISVDPNFTPPDEKEDGRISTGAVVGIVLGIALMFLLVLGVLWWKGYLRGKDEVHNGMILGANGIVFLTTNKESNYRAVETILLQHGLLALKRYKYSEIKKMTKSFCDKLGQGGYGSVYKGNLPDGTLVAIKVLSATDENVEDLINEVASISRTSHVNIVRLLGFCFDRKKRALVYEYMPNKSLDKYISKSGSAGTNYCLDLEILYKIAVGVAEGLDYLHRGCNTRIVHFDIKPQNILLDEEFCPKISDFGLAKLCKKKQSLLSVLGTRGTVGYIAPEVFSRNYGGVSHKSDVYSYGMMVLEMVGANMVADHTNETTQSMESYFPDKIYERLLAKTRKLDGFTIEVKEETATKMLLIGFWCIQTNPLDRPSISKVVEMLEGSFESIQIPPKPVLFTPTLPVWGVSSSFSSYVETQPSDEGVTHTQFEMSEKGSG